MTFRWGTVTAVSPLRVRLDGDSAALPFTPDSLANVMFGDRVRCEISDRRVVVIGRAGGSGPIGEHIAGEWASGSIPSGCVLANGAVLNIADYPKLAAHYAAVYGSANFHGGNGTTTFAVPDTRERVYVNQGGSDIFAAIGSKTGAKTHTLTVAEMPAHAHGPIAAGTSILHFVGTGGNIDVVTGSRVSGQGATGATGGGQPHNNVQPSFVCRYVIRAA